MKLILMTVYVFKESMRDWNACVPFPIMIMKRAIEFGFMELSIVDNCDKWLRHTHLIRFVSIADVIENGFSVFHIYRSLCRIYRDRPLTSIVSRCGRHMLTNGIDSRRETLILADVGLALSDFARQSSPSGHWKIAIDRKLSAILVYQQSVTRVKNPCDTSKRSSSRTSRFSCFVCCTFAMQSSEMSHRLSLDISSEELDKIIIEYIPQTLWSPSGLVRD